MRVIKKSHADTKKKFISIDELFDLLMGIENMSMEHVAQWLIRENILKKTKALVLENDYLLLEYGTQQTEKYESPLAEVKKIADGGSIIIDCDIIGFARKRLLNEIKNNGIEIPQKIIDESLFYMPNNSYEYDDNFYKYQCEDLMNEKGVPQKAIDSDSRYARLLNPKDIVYSSKLHGLAEMTYTLNVQGGYDGSGRKKKETRISEWVTDNHERFGFSNSPHTVKSLSALIVTLADQKTGTDVIRSLGEKVTEDK